MKCIFKKHIYVEVDRYLMFIGSDRVFYKCTKCGKEKDEYTLDTYLGEAKAPSYSEWHDARLKQIMSKHI